MTEGGSGMEEVRLWPRPTLVGNRFSEKSVGSFSYMTLTRAPLFRIPFTYYPPITYQLVQSGLGQSVMHAQ